jgi:primase-polymerase (primpol)-like protein
MRTNSDRGLGLKTAQFHRLPGELRALPQWCVTAGTTIDKAPYAANGRRASSTDPSTWMDFDTACSLATTWGGLIGFMLSAADPFACIDLDVKDNTSQEQRERYGSIIASFDSYTEGSRSGQGAHIWVRGSIGPGCKRDGVEVYSQERFIICTGNVWHDKPIEDRQEMLANMVTQMRPADYTAEALPDQPETEADTTVISRAMKAANAEKFASLANGQWPGRYPTQSEADMALMSIIAFYTPNNAQCRRIFRLTELGKREKATKDDRYLNKTLEPIRRRQAAESARTAAMRESFKLTGEGMPTNGDAPLPPTMDIGEMFDDLVYLAAEKQMALFRSNPSIQLPTTGMAALLKHNRTIVPASEDDPVEREIPTFNLWQSSAQRKVAYTLTFDPSEAEFCKADDGRPAYNLWKPRTHNPPADWHQRAQLFLDHVAFLVPLEEERDRFLDWMAHIEQQPGTLPHNHYLMIATQQGVGRNWLAGVLAHVWSGHVAMDFDLKASLASGFNGQLSRKLLAVVAEPESGGSTVKSSSRWSPPRIASSTSNTGFSIPRRTVVDGCCSRTTKPPCPCRVMIGVGT